MSEVVVKMLANVYLPTVTIHILSSGTYRLLETVQDPEFAEPTSFITLGYILHVSTFTV